MKIIRRLSQVLFALAFVLIFSVFFNVSIPFLTQNQVFIGIILLGALAQVLNLINAEDSKDNTTYTIVYWIGAIVVLIGLGFKLLHWPGALILIIAGLAILLFSLLMPKKKKKQTDDSDILDNF